MHRPIEFLTVNGYYQDGCINLVGSDPLNAAVDLRPNALIPFAAPTNSPYTVSAEAVSFFSKTAVGLTSSGAVNKNFESSGQAWLEVDFTGKFPAGGSTFINKWTFHTGGLTGPTFSGTFNEDPSSFNTIAVSYDPQNHVATAAINGVVVATTPYNAQAIKYAGVEGSWYSCVDNFSVKTGAIAVPPPATVIDATTTLSTTSTSSTGTVSSSVLGTDQQAPLV